MKRSGVTLLEVLMVVMISTATLSIATLSWNSMHRTVLARGGVMDDADELLRCMRLARETAVMGQCDVSIRHVQIPHPTTKEKRTAIECLVKPSPYRPAVDVNQVSVFGSVPSTSTAWMVDPIWLNERAEIRSNAATLTFHPDGTTDADVNWQVTTDRSTVTVIVYARTGNIQLQVSP